MSRAELGIPVEQSSPGAREWFPLEANVEFSDGLNLSEANAVALFYSPTLRRARADARVTGALTLQAGLLANPELFLGPRISTRDSKVVFPASLSWEVPLWGKREAEREKANALFTQAELRVVKLELDVLEHVRLAFFRISRLTQQVATLEAVAEASSQVMVWAEDLRGAGVTDSVSVFLARAEENEASAALEEARLHVTRARMDLFELLGLLPGALVEVEADSASILPALDPSEKGHLLRLPALRVAEAAYEAAEAALRLEVSKQYPTFQLGPEFEDDRGESTIGLGLSVRVPLFDRNKGGIAAAAEARERARDLYTRALLGVSHAQARSREELKAAELLLRIHSDGALRTAESAAEALQVRLRAGAANIVEVLATHRAIARTRTRQFELQERVLAAQLSAAVTSGVALAEPQTDRETENRK